MTVEGACGGRTRESRTGMPYAVACGGGPLVPLRTARVRRCRCRVRPTLAADVRPCRAPPPPCSPHPRRRRPHMSGAGPAMFAPHPTTVIPAKAGIQVGFRENERAARCAGGHVGHHRWIRGVRRSLWGDEPGSPPCAGMTVSGVCRGRPRESRTGAPHALACGWCGGRGWPVQMI
jgi:hypothetical protein